MIPFVTEAIYQNLVRAVRPGAPASVHHTRFPERDASREDAVLAAEMEAIIHITGIALSARDAKKLKLRQPLSKMTIGPRDTIERTACEQFHEMLMDELNVKEIEVLEPSVASPLQFSVTANFKSLGKRAGTKMKALAAAIEADAAGLAARLNTGDQGFTLTVEGEPFELTREDLKVVASSPENTTCAEEKGTWVAFDTVITDELATEGRAREIQRRVQVLRKDKGLEVEDRIALGWFTDAPSLAAAMTDHKPTLAAELLATLFEPVAAAAELDNPATIEIDGAKLFVEIGKA
jgi:isoleucyl-tRNA synthetase